MGEPIPTNLLLIFTAFYSGGASWPVCTNIHSVQSIHSVPTTLYPNSQHSQRGSSWPVCTNIHSVESIPTTLYPNSQSSQRGSSWHVCTNIHSVHSVPTTLYPAFTAFTDGGLVDLFALIFTAFSSVQQHLQHPLPSIRSVRNLGGS